MTLYFFNLKSCPTGVEINALAGVKGMIIEPSLASTIHDGLKEIVGRSGAKPSLLAERYWILLEEASISADVQEELHHFEVISRSRCASFLHVRNVLSRIMFARKNHSLDSAQKVAPSAVYRSVLHLFDKLTAFHSVAFPIVESHFAAASAQAVVEPALYTEQYRAWKVEFERDSIEPLEVARLIDERVLLKESPVGLISSACPSSARLFVWSFSDLFYVHAAWLQWFRFLYSNLQIATSYLAPRLFGRAFGSAQRPIGLMPALLSKSIIIDPAGFSDGKLSGRSQETSFANGESKELSDFLWHCLSRAAVARSMMRNGVAMDQCLEYYNMLSVFQEEWSPSPLDARLREWIDIDLVVGASDLSLAQLERMALNVFNCYRDEVMETISSGERGLFRASYIHI